MLISDPPQAETPKGLYGITLAQAKALSPQCGPDEIKAILIAVAEAKLSPIETSMVLDAIAATAKVGKSAVRAELRQIVQQQNTTASDLALQIAKMVLEADYQQTHLSRSADGSYWHFTGSHWRETSDAQVRNRLLNRATELHHLGKGSLAALVNGAKTCLDDLLGTDEDVLGLTESPAPVVNCANGELWIEADASVSLKQHKSTSRLTYCLPIAYDPGATCSRYDKALLDIFSKAENPEDVVRHWHEFVGYAIQPRRDIPSFWMLIGHGSNGKSVLLKTLQQLVGPEAVLNDQIGSFLRDRFNIAALAGKLMLIDDDLAEDTVLADGLLKKISEAKEVSARHAYGRRKFSFRSLALPIMAGNGYPRTDDVSHGMIRRAQVFPFDRIFDKGNADASLFPAIWQDEMPGVLNRALEGLRQLRKRGGFKVPSACEGALHDFMTHAMPLVAFIDGRCQFNEEARLRLCDFRTAMRLWASDQGVKRPSADKTLRRKLLGVGFKVSKVKGYETIFGLELIAS